MASVTSVASHALSLMDVTTTMKLQKLVFYSQALSLARTGSPLFDERIEAWVNGPVCPALFQQHRGKMLIYAGDLQAPQPLSRPEQDIVARVVDVLGRYTGNELSAMTHREAPWKDARGSLPASASSHEEITRESMLRFYSETVPGNPLFAAGRCVEHHTASSPAQNRL